MNAQNQVAVSGRRNVLAVCFAESAIDHVLRQMGHGLVKDHHGPFSQFKVDVVVSGHAGDFIRIQTGGIDDALCFERPPGRREPEGSLFITSDALNFGVQMDVNPVLNRVFDEGESPLRHIHHPKTLCVQGSNRLGSHVRLQFPDPVGADHFKALGPVGFASHLRGFEVGPLPRFHGEPQFAHLTVGDIQFPAQGFETAGRIRAKSSFQGPGRAEVRKMDLRESGFGNAKARERFLFDQGESALQF